MQIIWLFIICILELPGVKIRLTKWGAEEVKNVGVKVLGEEISQLKGFRFLHSFAERGLLLFGP